jgi:hypothetical protein
MTAKPQRPRPLTDGMLTILRALAAGKPIHTVWASGRSHQGGLTTAMHALYKRGLITHDYKLTDAGRAASGVLGTFNEQGQKR